MLDTNVAATGASRFLCATTRIAARKFIAIGRVSMEEKEQMSVCVWIGVGVRGVKDGESGHMRMR